jgi:hypothetical protein
MPTDTTRRQIEVMFSGLHHRSATKILPKPGTLSENLSKIVERTKAQATIIDQETLGFFATAAVEMWHRSVHSFLISALLTKASPLWASVSGYYSSHYSVRAFAHLLGYFHLQSKHRIIHIEVKSRQYVCNILQKQGSDREHKFYWKIVKNHARFAADPFFTKNEEGPGQSRSDSGHRSKANYIDHLNQFPAFQILDAAYLKERVKTIAGIPLSDAPIPKVDAYPDTDNVQLVAYHRMVKFMEFVDDVLGGSNRFWTASRRPDWCPSFLTFQVVQPEYTSVYKEHR